jgi:hypothetical protein
VPDSPFLPAAPLPITRDTPFRATGDVTLETWTKQFRTAGAPFSDALLEQMWQAAKPVSALVLDRLRIESSYCTAHPLPNTNNCLGLRVPGSLDFAAFYSPVDGIKEVVRRWATRRIAGHLRPEGPEPRQDADEVQPAHGERHRFADCLRRDKYQPVAGSASHLTAAADYHAWAHTSGPERSRVFQFPGSRRPDSAIADEPAAGDCPLPRDKYIQHETGNLGAGANALMHSRYLDNGAEGQQLSYHFTVDEREAYLKIPLDEVTWHGGDGGSGARCNYTGISCELCVQDNNAHKVQARHNAEELAGKIIAAAKLTMLRSHAWCCTQANAGPGCHYGCPATMFADGYFDQFVANALAWSRK